jgi:hypothetical protein
MIDISVKTYVKAYNMKIPTNREVSAVLTAKKLFHSKLNEVNVSNWTNNHKNEWAKITDQEFTFKPSLVINKSYVKKGYPPSHPRSVKVMRMVDGHIFNSIMECMEQENLYKVLMAHLLKQGITYQKV